MKFSAVVLAAAAGVSAAVSNVTYTTEVVTAYTTYCPEPTKITHGGKTYTITKATTLTITDCPCTITKPVITTPVVVCKTCTVVPPKNTTVIVLPPPTTAGVVTKTTVPGVVTKTGDAPKTTGTTPPKQVPVAGAGKVAALSGAGLAGIVGLAAFVL